MPWCSEDAVVWTGVPVEVRAAVLRRWIAARKKLEVDYLDG